MINSVTREEFTNFTHVYKYNLTQLINHLILSRLPTWFLYNLFLGRVTNI